MQPIIVEFSHRGDTNPIWNRRPEGSDLSLLTFVKRGVDPRAPLSERDTDGADHRPHLLINPVMLALPRGKSPCLRRCPASLSRLLWCKDRRPQQSLDGIPKILDVSTIPSPLMDLESRLEPERIASTKLSRVNF